MNDAATVVNSIVDRIDSTDTLPKIIPIDWAFSHDVGLSEIERQSRVES